MKAGQRQQEQQEQQEQQDLEHALQESLELSRQEAAVASPSTYRERAAEALAASIAKAVKTQAGVGDAMAAATQKYPIVGVTWRSKKLEGAGGGFGG